MLNCKNVSVNALVEFKNQYPKVTYLTSLSIKTLSPDGSSELYFKMSLKTPFQKLITAYCDRNQVDPQSVRFFFDGVRIRYNQTPLDLEMEDGDAIDVMVGLVAQEG